MDSVTHAASGALLGMAVSQWVLPEATGTCIVLGILAGSLPDLDFLAEFRGKVAAWKYHRILCHNLPVALILTVGLACFASYSQSLPIGWMLILCIAATVLHLCLDVLTSFGTCLFYPVSKKRYSTRSHFIVDPFVLGICLYGIVTGNTFNGLLALLLYVLFSLVLKQLLQMVINARLPPGLSGKHLTLEPIFLAPFRWLVIVKTATGYAYSYQNFFWQSQWYARDHEAVNFESLCQQHDLMKYVLETFDMPLFQLCRLEDECYLLVEDLKWRSEHGFRPLAFTLKMEQNNHRWVILDASQGGFFQRSNTALFQTPAIWEASKT